MGEQWPDLVETKPEIKKGPRASFKEMIDRNRELQEKLKKLSIEEQEKSRSDKAEAEDALKRLD